MSFGLNVVNAGGYTVIDERYRNYELKATGSIYVPGYNSTNGDYGTEFNYPEYSPTSIILMKNESSTALLTGWITTQNTIRLALMKGDGTLPPSGHVSGTVQWAVIDLIRAPAPDTFGLRVFDASGAIVFDSAKRYMKFRDNFTISSLNRIPVSFTTSVSSPWVLLSDLVGPSKIYMQQGGIVMYLVYIYFRTQGPTLSLIAHGYPGPLTAGSVPPVKLRTATI